MQLKRHVCPRNCFSTCSMISYVENGQLQKVTGDPENPYTNGRICAKGLSYVDHVYHKDRLKYPMYQKNKGSGRFERISWESAYDMIVDNWLAIDQQYGSLLPVGLYKYTGDLSAGHYAPEEFFSSMGPTTRIVGSPCAAAGFDAAYYDFGIGCSSDPEQMEEAELIVIWGANPAVTSIHSIRFLENARKNGALVVVIDPVLTKTAELADFYLQINPGTDGIFANALTSYLIDQDLHDEVYLNRHSHGFDAFKNELKGIDHGILLQQTGLQEEAVSFMKTLLTSSSKIFHWIGLGFQRHTNGGQMVRTVNALGAVQGLIGKPGSGVHYAHADTWIFENQTAFFKEHLEKNNRILPLTHWIDLGGTVLDPPLESLWISCRNPLIQDPQPGQIREHLKHIPFVVTADLFMTETAKWSNLVLPVTSFFEEEDIATSYWHRGFAYNEQAIEPYHESKSDYTIMKELARRIDHRFHSPSAFPTDLTKREYLNRQWNDNVRRQFGFSDVHEAVGQIRYPESALISWKNHDYLTPSGKFEFYSDRAQNNGLPALPIHKQQVVRTDPDSLQLFTTHDSRGLNSQFKGSRTIPERATAVHIHAEAAAAREISDGELVRVFNENASLTMKAKVTSLVHPSVALIYQGSATSTDEAVNQLVSVKDSDMGEHVSGSKSIAYYDSFVNIKPKQNHAPR
ncbi:molybdopterin-dependent oxidoreductase [Salisediminibacterium beveridgei]|uniref:Molybdopterin oxidoreductase n=1 Tax=Salisediminibacterium beveridgei TaxID=632773 RepID=A0A1D7QRW1_9BACI|nr:molybdopterin-dependent oxidoreductase [Salisediminibacterium beveridgei]AOM81728.1 molybdopterin oxidoreductase [Salisediminibacterium beveridgei]